MQGFYNYDAAGFVFIMGSIHDAIDDFDRLTDFIENDLPEYAEQVLANDIASLVTNRVVQKGENYKGGSFSPYSTKTVLAFRFWGKSRTQTAERKVREVSRKGGALSYVEFRELNNLKTQKKNYNFTGEMWRKFGVKRVEKRNGGFTIIIGGTTEAAQMKIDENSDREGLSIIEANKAEKRLAEQSLNDYLESNSRRILKSI